MVVSNDAAVSISGANAHLFVGDGYGLSGLGGEGLLYISSGGTVTVNNTNTVNQRGAVDIGTNEFGRGTVVVAGAGSLLETQGTDPHINVGNYGQGELSVLAGGRVNSLSMAVGNMGGAQGTVNINGSGSRIVLSNDTHSSGFDGDVYAGSMFVGNHYGSSGVLNITQGGVLEIRNSDNENAPILNIGNRDGSEGIVTVDGIGSAVEIHQVGGVGGALGEYRGGAFVQVGRLGQGTLTVSNGAAINMTGAYGQFRVSRGIDDDEGDTSVREELSEAFILSGSDVTLSMTGGSFDGYAAIVRVGARTTSNGRLTIDGVGSSLTIHGDNVGDSDFETAKFLVGDNGWGEVTISNGADVFIDGGDDRQPMLVVGRNAGSSGALEISGSGSTINLATTNTAAGGGGYIAVGRWSGSVGTMSVLSGAQVINDLGSDNSVMTVGRSGAYNGDPASIGTVLVDGNGDPSTLLDAGHLLVIGADWDPYGGQVELNMLAFGGAALAPSRSAMEPRFVPTTLPLVKEGPSEATGH